MPEGPEVTIISRQLAERLRGKLLTDIRTYPPTYDLEASINEIAWQLDDKQWRITDVRKKGKLIYFWLIDTADEHKSMFIANNLGLSGHWTVQFNTHTIAELVVDGDNNVYYNDARHFGRWNLYDLAGINAALNRLGPDILPLSPRPFENELLFNDNPANVVAKFMLSARNYPRKQIVQLLMDQSIVSGIGNYIKAEALYAARIHPAQTPREITDNDLQRLIEAAIMIATDSLLAGGVSLRDYKDIYGVRGQYVTAVYNRRLDPLGNEVVRAKFKDQRTTHYVPAVQLKN